jgi:quinol monooxygenase YgiN
MKRLFLLLAASALIFAQAATERIYVVTHVDLVPPFAEEGGKLIKAFVLEARKDAGVVRYEAFIEPARLNHITLVSVWESKAAFDKHLAQQHTRQFREKVQPMLGGPIDERLHVLLQ